MGEQNTTLGEVETAHKHGFADLTLYVRECTYHFGTGTSRRVVSTLEVVPETDLSGGMWAIWKAVIQQAGKYHTHHYDGYVFAPAGGEYHPKADNSVYSAGDTLTLRDYIRETDIDPQDALDKISVVSMEPSDFDIGDILRIKWQPDPREEPEWVYYVVNEEANPEQVTSGITVGNQIGLVTDSGNTHLQGYEGRLRIGPSTHQAEIDAIEVLSPENIDAENQWVIDTRTSILERHEERLETVARAEEMHLSSHREETWTTSAEAGHVDKHARLWIDSADFDDPVSVKLSNIFDFGLTVNVEADGLGETTENALEHFAREHNPIGSGIRM